MPKADARAVDDLLSHNVVDVINLAHLQKRLLAGEKLRVKLGVDPTAPDIHLGFAVVLRKLRAFQDLGHTAVLIVGDATALIGDPSGRKKTRPPLFAVEIQRNARGFLAQAKQILAPKPLEVRRNSEWLSPLTFADLIRLAGKLTVQRLLERDDFQKRLKARAEIFLHEFLYPLAQAYDSVAVRADLELGGTDQLWNLLTGRDLQRKLGQEPQDVLTTPLLVGLDGKEKMSKSLQNYVGITEQPDEMVGKLLTIPDTAIPDYARLAANWEEEDIRALPARLKHENPRDVKLAVARGVVTFYHGARAADTAVKEWLRVVHGRELPREIPTKKLRHGRWGIPALLVAAGLTASKSEAKRVHAQGGLRHNEIRVDPEVETFTIRAGDLLQVGKRKFVRVG